MSAPKYTHILSEFFDSIWAILPAKFAVIKSFLLMKADGGEVSAEEIALIKQAPREPVYFDAAELTSALSDPAQCTHPESDRDGDHCYLCGGDIVAVGDIAAAAPSSSTRSKAGSVAVLPLTGTISHRMGMMSEISGGTSTERFSGWLKAALKDPNVKAIVIDCDSPGGTVDGVAELADEIYKGKAQKPIVGVSNGMSASAAYYLLSQCSEIVITPSGQVGSIGVFAAHEDISKAAEMEGVKVSLVSAGKYKTEGNPFEPLTDEARAALQGKVNEYYDAFTKAVARGRGVAVADVRNGFGEGRMVLAQQAVKDKMADRVATLDQTLSRLGATVPSKQIAAEQADPTIAAQALATIHATRARELEL